MASLTANRVKSATLSSTTVDDVTLSGYYSGVEVLNRGTGAISFTVNGGTPTALGDECYVVPAGESLVVPSDNPSSATIVVKLIGNGDAYTVTGLR